ncbi:MAG: hypothetical protein ABIH34_03570 [Nanoarchaeota archaeon]
MMLPKFNIRTLIFILLPIAVASVAIAWDLQRLDKDFNHLYLLLKTARWDAFYKDTTIIVRFNGNMVIIASTEGNVTVDGHEEAKIGLNVYRKK